MTPRLPGKFVWFEHVCNDIAKARAFYEPLLGWHVEATPMGAQTHHLIYNGHERIGGFRAAEADTPSHCITSKDRLTEPRNEPSVDQYSA